jgi:hypothetical protein
MKLGQYPGLGIFLILYCRNCWYNYECIFVIAPRGTLIGIKILYCIVLYCIVLYCILFNLLVTSFSDPLALLAWTKTSGRRSPIGAEKSNVLNLSFWYYLSAFSILYCPLFFSLTFIYKIIHIFHEDIIYYY